MTDLVDADLVRLDADLGTDKHDVIRGLAAGAAVGAAAMIALKSLATQPTEPAVSEPVAA